MQELNLPKFEAKIREVKGKQQIFDIIRKKYVALTPEEWVRQHFIHFMICLGYPASLMAIETLVIVNSLRQRADIVLYNRRGEPALIVECKAPSVTISGETLNQAARYNIPLKVKYVILTNGLTHFCIELNGSEPRLLKEFPSYEEINTAD